jgi:hypothetical protein
MTEEEDEDDTNTDFKYRFINGSYDEQVSNVFTASEIIGSGSHF